MSRAMLAAGALVALLAACPPSANPLPRATFERLDGGDLGTLRLLGVNPSKVPLHGGPVNVSFSGQPPDAGVVLLIGDVLAGFISPDTTSPTTVFAPSQPAPGPADLFVAFIDAQKRPSAVLHGALEYFAAPAAVTATLGGGTFNVPVMLELSYSCSRSASVTVTNSGDVATGVHNLWLDSTEFTVNSNACGAAIDGQSSCNVAVCFSPMTVGTHSTTFSALTDAGVATVSLTATAVRAGGPLDPTFARTGVGIIYVQPSRMVAYQRGVLAASFPSRWMPAEQLVRLLPDGTMRFPARYFFPGSQTPLDVAPNPSTAGWFLLLNDNGGTGRSWLARYDALDTPDRSFGDAGVVLLGSAFPRRMEASPTGVLLIISGDAVTALTPGGAFAPWGDGGIAALPSPPTGAAVVDSRGTLYVGVDDGVGERVLPFSPEGAPLPAISTGGLLAVDPQDRLTIATARDVLRVELDGGVTQVSLTGGPPPAVDAGLKALAVDTRGRIIVSDAQRVSRWTEAGVFDTSWELPAVEHLACAADGSCFAAGTFEHQPFVAKLKGN